MKKIMLMLALCGALYNAATAQVTTSQSSGFDDVMKESSSMNGPGVTALVSKGGKVIYKKAFGLANVELKVPMDTGNVFRIASITKQFTAIAILQLMEREKLSLQDEITRFIPDYPVQGAKITIEHLLTHTSGIRDYSSIPDSVQRFKMDFTPTELINSFKNLPMRFAPGSRYEYSNSNYALLGHIIEKITGKTYQQYLEDNFFQPLGMTSSFYGDDKQLIRNRAGGYSQPGSKLENARAISMTQPYAAGAILSTVGDLFKWQQALQSYKLVKKETLRKAYTRYRLNNGKETNYGYGWRQGFIQESPSIWHGGLIDGFITMAMYLPEGDVYVTVMSNCNCFSPEIVTAKLAAIAIGKPYEDKEIKLADTALQTYAGVYENEAGDQFVISAGNGSLYTQRGRAPKVRVKAIKKDRFIFDDPMIAIQFGAGKDGKYDKLTIHSRAANEVWNKSDKPALPQAEIKVDEKILQLYTGVYEVSPQFSFTIIRENDRLFLHPAGQEKLEMFASADNNFFLKVNDATFEFISESGKVAKVILKQGGRTTDAIKVK